MDKASRLHDKRTRSVKVVFVDMKRANTLSISWWGFILYPPATHKKIGQRNQVNPIFFVVVVKIIIFLN